MSFAFQRLILWDWLIKASLLALSFAFVAGALVSYLSAFQIRFILWLFLAVIFALPWLMRLPFLKKRAGFYLFSSLMGICSGLTGLGGGMILSPFLHESEHIPAKNIPALVSCIMLFVSSFSLAGQSSQLGLFFIESSEDSLLIYFLLLCPAFAGLLVGYFVNVKQKNIKLRRFLLRIAVSVVFLKMTAEIFVQIL